jgi:hypothetical protein
VLRRRKRIVPLSSNELLSSLEPKRLLAISHQVPLPVVALRLALHNAQLSCGSDCRSDLVRQYDQRLARPDLLDFPTSADRFPSRGRSELHRPSPSSYRRLERCVASGVRNGERVGRADDARRKGTYGVRCSKASLQRALKRPSFRCAWRYRCRSRWLPGNRARVSGTRWQSLDWVFPRYACPMDLLVSHHRFPHQQGEPKTTDSLSFASRSEYRPLLFRRQTGFGCHAIPGRCHYRRHLGPRVDLQPVSSDGSRVSRPRCRESCVIFSGHAPVRPVNMLMPLVTS